MSFMRIGGIALLSSLCLSACVPPNMVNGGFVNPWAAPYPPAPAPMPAPAPASYVDVYKYQGSRQCGNNGIPLQVMRRELDTARIPVINSSCGRDGRMYPSFCGGADGRINIYTIPADAANAARSYGFLLISDLSGAQRTACVPGNNNPPPPPPSPSPSRPTSGGTFVPAATEPYPGNGGPGDTSYYSYH